MLVAIGMGVALVFAGAPLPASAEVTPGGVAYHPLTFPVVEKVTYTDDFGGARRHPGNDLMGAKLDHELAANDGTITFMRTDSSGTSGNMLMLEGDDGWAYWYIHINNDTPGTDDGLNPPEWAFAPGLHVGSKVKAGQFLAYMGDSGQAETTDPHLHFELHEPDGTVIDPYTSLKLAQGAGASGQCRYPSNPLPAPDIYAGYGFWALGADGGVFAFGVSAFYGRPPAPSGWIPYTALAPTPSAQGYWVVDALGDVYAFGDAELFGSMAGTRLNGAIVGITPTATGNGYWLLGADGGIFSFGDAQFYGSTGGMQLNAPVISMAATPTGTGYWLLGADGGIFSFGDAAYRGSVPGLGWCTPPPALSMARTRTSGGYWVLLADGRVVPFGDAAPWGQPSQYGARALMIAAYP